MVGCLEPVHLGGRLLNIPVPPTGHTPFKAGLPLAIFTCWALEIFRLALHFTQYPSSAAIGAFPAFAIAFLRSGAGAGGRGAWGGGQGRLPRGHPPGTVMIKYAVLNSWERRQAGRRKSS